MCLLAKPDEQLKGLGRDPCLMHTRLGDKADISCDKVFEV